MNVKLKIELAKKRILEMKKPTIMMNENDFEDFKKEVKSKTTINPDNNPTYQGVPIKTSRTLEKGSYVIYDDIPPFSI
jgi:hypothetical protein